MPEILDVITELAHKEGGAALRLRTVGRNGAPPVMGATGAPLPPVRVDLPLQTDGLADLRRWLEDAAAADWPAGRSLRVEVEDGAQVSIGSRTLSAAAITGRSQATTVEPPPWREPPARLVPPASLPSGSPVMVDASAPNLALLQLVQAQSHELVSLARDSMNAVATMAAGANATTRELSAQLGQSARNSTAQLDRLAGTVGKIAEVATSRNDLLHERIVQKTEEVGQAAAEASLLEQALSTASSVTQKRDPLEKLAALAPLLQAMHQNPRKAAPQVEGPVQGQPAPASAPPTLEVVDAPTLQAAAAGDAAARARVLATLAAGGGADSLGWLLDHG
jgi:hypothetical protein